MATEYSFNGAINSEHFLLIFLTVVFCFTCIALWFEFFQACFYDFSGFQRNNALNAFILAVSVTILVFILAYTLKNVLKF